MPVWAIIVVVVVGAAILLGLLLFALRRSRDTVRVKKRERELGRRRERVITEHRDEADVRARRAEEAEQRARIAEQEARRERTEAQLRQEQAALHERGMADHELVADHEREDFAGTSAVSDGRAARAERGEQTSRTSAYDEGRRAAHEPERVEEFRAGRGDEEGKAEQRGLLGRLRGS